MYDLGLVFSFQPKPSTDRPSHRIKMSLSETHTELLLSALSDEQKPFYAEGSLSIPPEQLNLLYKAGGTAPLRLELVPVYSNLKTP
jgi:hypothetical protein